MWKERGGERKGIEARQNRKDERERRHREQTSGGKRSEVKDQGQWIREAVLCESEVPSITVI
jgi:hypothetical protein